MSHLYNLCLDRLISNSLNKIEIQNNFFLCWHPITLTWRLKDIDETCIFIKSQILNELEDMKLKSQTYKYIKIKILEIKKKLFYCDKEIKNKLLLKFNSFDKKEIIFNNEFPFLLGFGDKYVLNLETKESRIRKFNDYFLYNIEYRKKKLIQNEICFPITDWFNNDEINDIQLILGNFLSGEYNQILYIFYGQGSNGKSLLLNILKILLGDYFIFVSEELFTNKNTLYLEEKYKLINRRLIVLDTKETDKISETKLSFLIKKYKNSKFIISTNDIPKFSHKYSTKGMLINISFVYSFRQNPIFSNDKKLKKYLDIDYDYIFSWLLEGCSRYINSKKTITTLANNYIKKYSIFEENFFKKDVFKRFINNNLILTDNPKDRIGFKELYSIYTDYEEELQSKISDRLKEKEFIKLAKTKFNFKKISKGNVFYNIKEKNEYLQNQDFIDILEQNKFLLNI